MLSDQIQTEKIEMKIKMNNGIIILKDKGYWKHRDENLDEQWHTVIILKDKGYWVKWHCTPSMAIVDLVMRDLHKNTNVLHTAFCLWSIILHKTIILCIQDTAWFKPLFVALFDPQLWLDPYKRIYIHYDVEKTLCSSYLLIVPFPGRFHQKTFPLLIHCHVISIFDNWLWRHSGSGWCHIGCCTWDLIILNGELILFLLLLFLFTRRFRITRFCCEVKFDNKLCKNGKRILVSQKSFWKCDAEVYTCIVQTLFLIFQSLNHSQFHLFLLFLFISANASTTKNIISYWGWKIVFIRGVLFYIKIVRKCDAAGRWKILYWLNFPRSPCFKRDIVAAHPRSHVLTIRQLIRL